MVQFGKTICYAAEMGEVEGQTRKRLDVEFGKKQGRRISPSSGSGSTGKRRQAGKLEFVLQFLSEGEKLWSKSILC